MWFQGTLLRIQVKFVNLSTDRVEDFKSMPDASFVLIEPDHSPERTIISEEVREIWILDMNSQVSYNEKLEKLMRFRPIMGNRSGVTDFPFRRRWKAKRMRGIAGQNHLEHFLFLGGVIVFEFSFAIQGKWRRAPLQTPRKEAESNSACISMATQWVD